MVPVEAHAGAEGGIFLVLRTLLKIDRRLFSRLIGVLSAEKKREPEPIKLCIITTWGPVVETPFPLNSSPSPQEIVRPFSVTAQGSPQPYSSHSSVVHQSLTRFCSLYSLPSPS